MKKLVCIALVSTLAILGCTSGRIVVVGESEPAPIPNPDYGRKIAAQEHTENGKKFLKKRKYGKAEKEFLAAIELDPNNHEAHYYLGLTYYRWEKYYDSVEYFRLAIELNSENPGWVNRTRVYIGLAFEYERDYSRAEREFYIAMTLDPSNKEAHRCWERVKYKHKEYQREKHDDDDDDNEEEDDD